MRALHLPLGGDFVGTPPLTALSTPAPLAPATLQVKIHHFRWRAGLDRSVADQLQQQQAEAEGCGSGATAAPAAWQEAQRVSDTILAKGAIDVGNAYLKCHLAEEPRLPRSGRRAGRPGMAAGIGQQPQQRAAASAGASGADHSEQ